MTGLDIEVVSNPVVPLLDRPDAPVWRRAVARILDLATVFMVLWALAVLQLLWFMGALSDAVAFGPWDHALAPIVLFFVLAAGFDAFFVRYNMGQTPGMDLLRIRVIGRTSPSVDGSAAIVRGVCVSMVWLVWPPAVAAALAIVVGTVVAINRSLAPQDRLARTRVVGYDRSAEDPDAPPRPSFLRRRRAGERDDDVAPHPDAGREAA